MSQLELEGIYILLVILSSIIDIHRFQICCGCFDKCSVVYYRVSLRALYIRKFTIYYTFLINLFL